MQTNLEAQIAHALHGRQKGQLARGLATGEDHPVQQTNSTAQQVLNFLPGHHPGNFRIDDRLIVAIRACPGTPLSEYRRHEFSRPVHAGHGAQTCDLQVRGPQGRKAHR